MNRMKRNVEILRSHLEAHASIGWGACMVKDGEGKETKIENLRSHFEVHASMGWGRACSKRVRGDKNTEQKEKDQKEGSRIKESRTPRWLSFKN